MEQIENIKTLLNEIGWLEQVVSNCINNYLKNEGSDTNWLDLAIPDLTDNKSAYAGFVGKWSLNSFDRLALALTMAPHVKPEVLDVFLVKNPTSDKTFTEFGGVIDKGHNGFLPTVQTLSFLIVSGNWKHRLHLMNLLGKESVLITEGVLLQSETDAHVPDVNRILTLNDRWLHFFLTGELKIEQTHSLLMQKISTKKIWTDLVVEDTVFSQLSEIISWLDHSKTIMEDWGLGKLLKPGYRALFYGPPGTGKTLAAMLLGKISNKDVYKVNLSLLVSKYIGETEKNLAHIFDIAEHKGWILFFDEADALFGNRSATNTSNDRYANQQTSYLLQRIEDFSGTVILASNLKSNIDQAFTRRFQSMIHFTTPSTELRYQLWKNAFSGVCTLDTDIDLERIAEAHELTGGEIINVLRYCVLAAVTRNDSVVKQHELMAGIKREIKRKGKLV